MAALYSALAGVVVVAHFAYLAVLVFGGFAAVRWPKVAAWHLAAVAWALGAVTFRYDCPLTSLEQQLRAWAGEGTHPEGFLRHYVRGVLFPDAWTPVVAVLIVALVLVGWIRLASTYAGRTRASGFPSPSRTAAGSEPSSRSRPRRTGSSPRS